MIPASWISAQQHSRKPDIMKLILNEHANKLKYYVVIYISSLEYSFEKGEIN